MCFNTSVIGHIWVFLRQTYVTPIVTVYVDFATLNFATHDFATVFSETLILPQGYSDLATLFLPLVAYGISAFMIFNMKKPHCFSKFIAFLPHFVA